jgi:hypothetical protein
MSGDSPEESMCVEYTLPLLLMRLYDEAECSLLAAGSAGSAGAEEEEEGGLLCA